VDGGALEGGAKQGKMLQGLHVVGGRTHMAGCG